MSTDPDDEGLSLSQRWAAERVSGRESFLLIATAVVLWPFVMIGKGLYALRWIVLGPWQLIQILRYLRRTPDE
ncbi:MAG: hypothetical protein HOU81_25460 [Hamadaea sp.]|uniref:hypothetical protein n=1 Tax=Hamadaea sp. TaxID=2024425 RepID=UPI0017B7BFBF|nr:hypothetical protein [Hamadaea sp.]NUR74171.1 hypothetical protein [Hamadaea sp.]NUT20505.1 hypothetical protein [Hamadaea sp.]